jgi:hypothetical protein
MSVNRGEANGRPIRFQWSTVRTHGPIEQSIYKAIIGQQPISFTEDSFTKIPLAMMDFRKIFSQTIAYGSTRSTFQSANKDKQDRDGENDMSDRRQIKVHACSGD